MAVHRIFPATNGPATSEPDAGASSGISLGVEFYVTSACQINAFFFWHAGAGHSTVSRTFRLYRVDSATSGTFITGTQVTTGTTWTGDAWNRFALASPVELTVNQRYRAVILTSGTDAYAATGAYWTANRTNGPLTAPSGTNATGADQCSYAYGSTIQFPTNSFDNANYWIDVEVQDTGGITAAVGQVSETDTSQLMARAKRRVLGQPSTADSAQLVVARKILQVGQVSGTDTARQISVAPIRRLVGQAQETDTADPVAWAPIRRLVGQVEETDSAQPVAVSPLRRLVGQVQDTATAGSISVSRTAQVGQPSEDDTAIPVTARKTVGVGQPVDTGTAQQVSRVRVVLVGQAAETDTSSHLGVLRSVALPSLRPVGTGTVSNLEDQADGTTNLHLAIDDDPDGHDADTTFLRRVDDALDASGFFPLTDMPPQFTEMASLDVKIASKATGAQVDDTLALHAQVFAADETTPMTGEAQLVAHAGPQLDYVTATVALTGVVAADKPTWDGATLRLRYDYTQVGIGPDGIGVQVTAVELNGVYRTTSHVEIVGRSDETDTAQPVAVQLRRLVGQAVEDGTAQPVGWPPTRLVQQAAETDVAQPFTVMKAREVGLAVEVDVAQPVTRPGELVVPVSQATTTDQAQQVTWAPKVRVVGQAAEDDTAGPVGEPEISQVGQAEETGTALPVSRLVNVTVAQVADAATAQALLVLKTMLLGQATETDVTQPVAAGGLVNVNLYAGPLARRWHAGPLLRRWAAGPLVH